jgi:hypothetical protein
MVARDFSVIAGLILLAVWIYLLLLGKINQWGLAALVLITVGFVGVLYNLENLSELTVQVAEGSKMTATMRQIRADVYAKADEVREIAGRVAASEQRILQVTDQLGQIAAFNLSHMGRFPPANLGAFLQSERDRLATLLTGLGLSTTRVAQIVQPVSDVMARDLARAVAKEAGTAATSPIHKEAMRDVADLLMRSPAGKAQESVRPVLESRGAWNVAVERGIAEFEEFRRTGRLPSDSRP